MRVTDHFPLFLALSLSAAPAMAMEAGETYVGGGLTRAQYETAAADDLTPTALVGRLGYHLTDTIALEGRLGYGVAGDDTDVTAGGMRINAEVDLQSLAGAYAVGHLPIGRRASAYGLAGFTMARAEFSGSAGGQQVSQTTTETGFSYGAGAQLALTDALSGYVEWTRYLDKDDYEASGLGIGALYAF